MSIVIEPSSTERRFLRPPKPVKDATAGNTDSANVLVIARLNGPDGAVADVYSTELHQHSDDPVRTWDPRLWWRTLSVPPNGHTVGISDIDAALVGHGYTRTCDWRRHVTASGAVRFFTAASVHE